MLLAAASAAAHPGPVRSAAPGGLRSLVAALAEGVPVELEREVKRVGPGPTVDGERADAVVLAMPDPQARRLLADDAPAAALVDGRRWRSVIAVASGWPRREWSPMPAAFVNDHPLLSLVADDGDRRGDGAPVLVAHTADELARRCDARPDDAVAPVLDALRQLLGLRSEPLWTHAHRWRYASPPGDREAPFHLGDDGIALAGDGWGSARVETAWRSGTALGRALVDRSTKSEYDPVTRSPECASLNLDRPGRARVGRRGSVMATMLDVRRPTDTACFAWSCSCSRSGSSCPGPPRRRAPRHRRPARHARQRGGSTVTRGGPRAASSPVRRSTPCPAYSTSGTRASTTGAATRASTAAAILP